MRIVNSCGRLSAAVLAVLLAGPPWPAGTGVFHAAEHHSVAGVQAGSIRAAREEILSSLEDSPEQHAALEELALQCVAVGDILGADAAYARLLGQSLSDHVVALGYAVARLHLHQEYEAHTALFAAAKNPENDPAAIAAAAAVLEKLYDPQTLSVLLREQFPDPAQAADVDAISALWTDLVTSPPPPTHGRARRSPSAVLGAHHTRSFLALYYGFLCIARGQFDAGRSEFRVAIETAPDERTAFTARAGYKLLEGVEAGAPSSQLLDSFYLVSLDRGSTIDTSAGVFPLSTVSMPWSATARWMVRQRCLTKCAVCRWGQCRAADISTIGANSVGRRV